MTVMDILRWEFIVVYASFYVVYTRRDHVKNSAIFKTEILI